MKKLEAKFCSIYQQWVRAIGYKYIPVAPWEAKHDRGRGNIPFSDVPEVERNALFQCTTDEGYIYKISDMSAGVKGFDGFFYKNSPSYLVFAYKNMFYLIDLFVFLNEENINSRKSLTEQRASEICFLKQGYKL